MTSKKYALILLLIFLVTHLSPVFAKDDRGVTVTAVDQTQRVDWGKYYALIIGINAYKEWNPLQTAVKDAEGLRDILSSLKSFLIDSKLFFPKLSYYDLGFPLKTKMINKNTLPDDVINSLWISTSFFSKPEPNVELICKLGRELEVDLILICYLDVIESRSVFPQYLNVNLINVKTRKVNSAKESFSSAGLDVKVVAKKLFEKVFHTFEKSES